MLIHKFIDGEKPNMVLIHGVLTPWQIWTPQIEYFKSNYNVYVIALNSHTEEEDSFFVSAEAEANEVIELLNKENVTHIDVLCGVSLGGKISFKIWQSQKIPINNLIMDGAPLVSCPKIATKVMCSNYKNIIRKSKARDRKVIENFKKHFLPEKYLENYLRIADRMTYEAIENIVNSAFREETAKAGSENTRILFIHGTKGNEILSKKSARFIKKLIPASKIIYEKGDSHCYKAIYQPRKWIETVSSFLNA